MLVRMKLSTEEGICGLTFKYFHKIQNLYFIFLERLLYALFMKSGEMLFFFSPANAGRNIYNKEIVKESDLLHFHWINQGFISLRHLNKLLASGKKIVWTLHDMWPFTGGCHYSGACNRYVTECGECPFLRTHNAHDLSYKVFRKKLKIYKNTNMTIVSPSNWLAEKARASYLMKRFPIVVIPNPIDTEIFKPENKFKVRKVKEFPSDKFLILAGSANLKDKRKGFHFLLEALKLLISRNPAIKGKIGLVTFGKYSGGFDLPCDFFPVSYLSDEKSVATLYQLSDVYVLPSVEDNLPGTVMESLSCGTPVVAFNIGGIPEMVDHEINGYLTDSGNIKGICEGIEWAFHHTDIMSIRENCRKKVIDNFTNEIISGKYYSLYDSLIRTST